MLIVDTKIIQNPELTDLDVAVWCFAKIAAYSGYTPVNTITGADIAYQIYNTLTLSHGIRDSISRSLIKLIEANYLSGEKIGGGIYAVTISSFEPTEYYIKVEPDDLRRIMQLPNHPAAILRQYLYILSTINLKTKCGMWSITQLAENLDSSEKTVMRNNQQLEEMKLLYIYHAGDQQTTNTYGRWEDKAEIENYGDCRTGGTKRKSSANYKRRMRQLYNQVAKGHKYNSATMQEIREYCEQENEIMKNTPHIVPNLYNLQLFD